MTLHDAIISGLAWLWFQHGHPGWPERGYSVLLLEATAISRCTTSWAANSLVC